jgi:hypothetical protein
MGWTVAVTGGDSAVTIASHAAFDWKWIKNVAPNGQVQSVDHELRIRGRIVASTPAAVADAFVLLKNEVTESTAEVTVEVALDGTSRFTMNPADGFFGPHVISFESVPDDGSADSHWQYEMVIIFKGKGSETNAQNFATSLQVVTNHGRIIRKVWTVSAQGFNFQQAETFCKTFKPSGEDVEEDRKIDPIEARASYTWTWVALQEVHCEVRSSPGGGLSWEPEGQVGEEPILHQTMREPEHIVVSGYVRGYKQGLKPPSAHFAETETMTRDSAKESKVKELDGPIIENEEKGIYRLPFEERWISTGPRGEANHASAHHLIGFETPPGDGKITS